MNLKFAIVENVYWLNIGNITTKISKKKESRIQIANFSYYVCGI